MRLFAVRGRVAKQTSHGRNRTCEGRAKGPARARHERVASAVRCSPASGGVVGERRAGALGQRKAATHAKVGQAQVAVAVAENVGRFDVAVHQVAAVEIFHLRRPRGCAPWGGKLASCTSGSKHCGRMGQASTGLCSNDKRPLLSPSSLLPPTPTDRFEKLVDEVLAVHVCEQVVLLVEAAQIEEVCFHVVEDEVHVLVVLAFYHLSCFAPETRQNKLKGPT